jgi:hypothetical protein
VTAAGSGVRLTINAAHTGARAAEILLHVGRHYLEEAHLLSDGLRLDPAMVLIAQTVRVATLERQQKRDGGVPVRPMSRRAISVATGLPRETIRRRVARLVELGVLAERGGGIVPAEAQADDPRAEQLMRHLAHHVALTNALLREGLVEMVPA